MLYADILLLATCWGLQVWEEVYFEVSARTGRQSRVRRLRMGVDRPKTLLSSWVGTVKETFFTTICSRRH